MEGFINLGDKYFGENNEFTDADLLYKYTSTKVAQDSRKKTRKKCLSLAEKATKLDPTNYLYHYNVAAISYQLKQKRKALKAGEKALALCQNEDNKANVQELLSKIKKL